MSDPTRQICLELSAGKRWAEAAVAWARLADTSGGFEALYRLAEANFHLGDFVAVVAGACKAMALAPLDERPLVLLARSQSRMKQWEAAEASWRQLGALNSGTYEYVARLAEALASINKLEEAGSTVTHAIIINPEARLALDVLTTVRNRAARAGLGDFAADICAGLVEVSDTELAVVGKILFSNEHESLLQIDSLLSQDQPERASSVLRVATSTFGRSAALLLREGRTWHRLENWPAAIEVWNKLVKANVDAFEPRFRLAQALRLDGNVEAARTHMDRAAELNPSHIGGLREALQIAAMDDDPTAAERAYRCAEAGGQNVENVRMEYIGYLIRVRQFEAARTAIGQHIAGGPLANGYGLLHMQLLLGESALDELIVLYAPLLSNSRSNGHAKVERLPDMRLRLLQAYAAKGAHADVLALSDLIFSADGPNVQAARVRFRSLVALNRLNDAKTLAKNWTRNCNDHAVWRDFIAAFAESWDIHFARELFDEATSAFVAKPGKWLAMVRTLTGSAMREPIIAHLAQLSPANSPDCEAACDVALACGMLDLAEQFVRASGLKSPTIRSGARLERIARIRDLFRDKPAHELVFPEVVLEKLARRFADKTARHNDNGPIVLVNSSLAGGGAERQLCMLICGLAARVGTEKVQLVCTRLTRDNARRLHIGPVEQAGVTLTDLDEAPPPDAEYAALPDEDRLLLDLLDEEQRQSILKLYACFLQTMPSVAHLWQDKTNIDGAIAALMAGVPQIVLSTRSTRPVTRQRLRRYMSSVYQVILRFPNIRMVNNSLAGALNYENWLGLPAGTVRVIHNGFDFPGLEAGVAPDSRATIRSQLGIPAEAPLLGGILRLSDVKNPLLWVEVASHVGRMVPEAHFFLAGDGPLRESVLEAAARGGIKERFHLPGYVEVPPWYAAMDVALLTSRTEGLPNVLVEAQSLGRPVVSTRVGGVAETLIEGETGFSIASACAEELAKPIIAFFRDPERMKRSGQQAKAFVQARFSMTSMIDHTLLLYRDELPEQHELAQAAPLPAYVVLDPLRRVRSTPVLAPDFKELMEEGRRAFEDRRNCQAHALFSAALACATSPTEPWRWLARNARSSGDLDGQKRLWQVLLRELPNDFEAKLRLAETLAEAGEFSEAVALMHKALAEHGSDERLLKALARILTLQGRHEDSFTIWARLCATRPTDVEAALHAGRAALQLGDPIAASYMNHAWTLSDCPPQAAIYLASLHTWNGKADIGRAVLRGAWRRFRGNADILRATFEHVRINGLTNAHRRAISCIESQMHKADPAFVISRLQAAGQATNAANRLETLLFRQPKGQASAMAARLATARLKDADLEGAERAAAHGLDLGTVEGEATAAQIWAARNFVSVLPLPKLSPTERYYGALAEAASSLRLPRYLPRPGLCIHLVNSLATGGSERQSVAMALADARALGSERVLVLRTDPAKSGRAVRFLETLTAAGIASKTVDETCGDIAELLKSMHLPPPGALRQALVPQRSLRLAAALATLRPSTVVAWFPREMADLALARLLMDIPQVAFRSGSERLDRRADTERESLDAERTRAILSAALPLPGTSLWTNSAANLNGWLDWLGLPRDVIRHAVLPNIIGPDLLVPPSPETIAAMRRRMGDDGRTVIVGTVARLEPEKGIDFWLDIVEAACAARHDVRFVLAGDGRLRQRLKRDIDRRGLADRATLLGELSADMPVFYAAIDALILTSRTEGAPNALIEAQAFGLPIVAADVGGVAEILPTRPWHRCIASRNPANFAAELIGLLALRLDRRLATSQGKRAVLERHGSATVKAEADALLAESIAEHVCASRSPERVAI